MSKKNFTRKNLSNNVHHDLGFSKNVSSLMIDDFFEFLVTKLIKFNKIKISSFGTFEVVDKKERIGRNQKTKVEAKIVARKVVKFKPSNTVKKKLNRQ